MQVRKAPARVKIEFARRLQAARIAAGYDTMRDFATALGVSEHRYRRWEAAETEPSIYWLMRISHETGTSLDVLISGARPA